MNHDQETFSVTQTVLDEEKRQYTPPKLTVYGSMTSLTAAGSGEKVELIGLSQKRRP